jgi:hypothetical protein
MKFRSHTGFRLATAIVLMVAGSALIGAPVAATSISQQAPSAAAATISPNSPGSSAVTHGPIGTMGCQETTATIRFRDGTTQGWYCSGTFTPKNVLVSSFSAGGWSGSLWQSYGGTIYPTTFCDWQSWSYVSGWTITKIYLSPTKMSGC